MKGRVISLISYVISPTNLLLGAFVSVKNTGTLSVIVACRQAPAQGIDHICFSSAVKLGSVDPEKVLVCCFWM